MTNAKSEFLSHVDFVQTKVKCAVIKPWILDDDTKVYNRFKFTLPCNYSPEQYSEFLNLMEFEYDDTMDEQMIFGTIWFDDDSWSARDGPYDSDWWVHHRVPPIPENLK